MKKLSIQEKASLYDEALKAAVVAHKDEDRHLKATLERIFPVLRESRDEEIWKWLIEMVEEVRKSNPTNAEHNGMCSEAIALLEKQCEQKKSYDTCDSSMFDNKKSPYGEKRDFGYFEEKSADKAEPEFKVGDWVVSIVSGGVYKITGLNSEYELTSLEGKYKAHLPIKSANSIFRLWSIIDAKPGDVLVCNEEILLFKSYSVSGRISLYCWYNGRTDNFHGKEVDDTLLTTRNKICPATKEQRDLLFTKMRKEYDRGYYDALKWVCDHTAGDNYKLEVKDKMQKI